MQIEQLNDYGACSSVIIKHFHEIDGSPEELAMYSLMISWCEPLDSTETLIEGVYLNSMSFATASILPSQKTGVALLKTLGFTFTEPVYNKKNGTRPMFAVAPIPVVHQKMKEWLSKGDNEKYVKDRLKEFSRLLAVINDEQPYPDEEDDEDDDWYDD